MSPNQPDREGQKSSVLDLILTNEEPMIDDEIEEIPPIGKSDHVSLFWLDVHIR